MYVDIFDSYDSTCQVDGNHSAYQSRFFIFVLIVIVQLYRITRNYVQNIFRFSMIDLIEQMKRVNEISSLIDESRKG